VPSIIAIGTLAQSASTVVTPTSLVPGLPGTMTAGDWLFCYTACTLPAATVATPSGWTSLCDITGTNGRLALFSHKVVGGETAPTFTWSGLTAGATGTPCDAHIVNMGTGFGEVAGALSVQLIGAVSNQAASTTVMAGGAGVTTTSDNTVLFAMGVRGDDAATGFIDAGTGVSWSGILADQSTSGNDMLTALSWAEKATAGTVSDHTWTVTGGTSVASSGVIVVLAPSTDPVPTLVRTYSRVRLRPQF
jgi:hypothetical protein